MPDQIAGFGVGDRLTYKGDVYTVEQVEGSERPVNHLKLTCNRENCVWEGAGGLHRFFAMELEGNDQIHNKPFYRHAVRVLTEEELPDEEPDLIPAVREVDDGG